MNQNIFSLWARREPPVILQSEEAECGLAALAMCAATMGYETDLLALRRRHEISLKGTTLARLLESPASGKSQEMLILGMFLNRYPYSVEVYELAAIALTTSGIGSNGFSLDESLKASLSAGLPCA